MYLFIRKADSYISALTTKEWTNSKEQCPCYKTNSHSDGQEILHLLWILIGNCVQNSPPPLSILSQINPVHTFPPYFIKTNSNLIFLYMSRSSKWSLSFRFSDQNFVHTSHLSHSCYTPCPSHPPCHQSTVDGKAVKWQVTRLLLCGGLTPFTKDIITCSLLAWYAEMSQTLLQSSVIYTLADVCKAWKCSINVGTVKYSHK